MNTLFAIEPAYPEGFSYIPDFIDSDEERTLMMEISKTELHHFNFHGFKANRKVASFGYDYSFDNEHLTKGKHWPVAFDFLIQKVTALLVAHDLAPFAELLVTEYPPGSVINWHRDAPPFDLIAGISLVADCTFQLRPQDKQKQGRSSVISFAAQLLSLYIIAGHARTDWQHSIAPVKETRFSVTLRTLRDKT